MSVLTSTEIERSPAQNYGDLLRNVPGLNVIQLSARDVNITSRQATGSLSNTQLVLLDGRSVYLDFFGIVLWDLLPTNTSDIKQIEVIRGPASAVWGANALTGVVNIITKTPREAKGSEVTFTGGVFEPRRSEFEKPGGRAPAGWAASTRASCRRAERHVVVPRRRRLFHLGGVSPSIGDDSADRRSSYSWRNGRERPDRRRRYVSD